MDAKDRDDESSIVPIEGIWLRSRKGMIEIDKWIGIKPQDSVSMFFDKNS